MFRRVSAELFGFRASAYCIYEMVVQDQAGELQDRMTRGMENI